jgi:mRNA interferase RelE/StbE
MDNFRLSFSKTATKAILKYDKTTRDRIYKALNALPYGDVKRLKGNQVPPQYRLRVGSIRIIFIKDPIKQQLLIQDIDTRGDIYK